MTYHYLDSISDVAFRAEADTPEELFQSAVDATVGTMVENLPSVLGNVEKEVRLSSDSLELLLFSLLQEIIYFKDAEQLLFRAASISLGREDTRHTLTAVLAGERIDPRRHQLVVDVKAVTLYRFSVEETPSGWAATVVLDV